MPVAATLRAAKLKSMIYLYETIPTVEGEAIRRYEIKQSIHDPAFTRHPETGESIRRVIVGGVGFITGKSGSSKPNIPKPSHGGCRCGGGGCGHR
jgi:hypothetical protein